MVRVTKLHWKKAKHILWYLRGTTHYQLWYRWTKGVKLCGIIDADWVGNPSNQKSTLARIFNVGSATVSWYNMKQRYVMLNSAEA